MNKSKSRYTYLRWKDEYQLYIETGNGITLYLVLERDYVVDILKMKYKAEVRATIEYFLLHEIWFKTVKDVKRAIAYLESRDVIEKLGGGK